MQLVEIPSQLLELNVQDFADTAAALQRSDEAEPPQPIVLRQSTKPFFFAWLQPALAFEFAKLVNALSRARRQILTLDCPVEECLEPTETTVA